MSKVQIFAKKASQGAQEFFRVKTRKEDWRYLPIDSRLPATRVRVAAIFALAVANKTFTKVVYHEQEQVRGAHTWV